MSNFSEFYIPIQKFSTEDFNELRTLESGKYMTIKETNPTEKEKLYILNYTEQCAFQRKWNKYTIQCRGLIVNHDGDIIARPFPKFFNMEEPEAIVPTGEEFTVSYKEDGSCGILYWIDNVPKIATRGSFNSDQAIKGTELLHTKYKNTMDKLDRRFTYIFEIIYPENKIVLDYGNREELILLGKIETSTGKDFSSELEDIGFPVRKIYSNSVKDTNLLYNDLKSITESNIEGFVLHFQKSNYRVKVKLDEYKRLHKIMTGLSEKGVWEMLRDKQDLSEYIKNVPDEFFKWFSGVKNDLEKRYKEIEERALSVVKEIKAIETTGMTDKEIQKMNALYIKGYAEKHKREMDISSIIFSMLKGGMYENGIWTRIEPKQTDNVNTLL